MKTITTILIATILLSGFCLAETTSDMEKIKEPITKIYDLMKAIISVLGVIAITAAGAMYMFSGNNIQTRENAKSMVSYAIVGLVLVWVAPLVVNYLTSP
jgi:RsiW-degrading membrane proteinase PrsW (M82 family)